MMGDRRRRRDLDVEVDDGLEARCRRRLIECGLWRCRDLSAICTRVGEMTGRRLVLSAMALGGHSIHGLLVSTEDVDYVIYEANTSRMHQDHIVMHELSHVICGHSGTITRGAEVASGTPTTSGVLRRHGYADLDEREAEMMASLLGQHIETVDLARAEATDPVLARILASFDLQINGS